MQQCALIIGIRNLPIINLTQFLDRGIGANGLSGEPSSAARIMSVLFLSMLRLYEIKYGRPLTIKELYLEAKWPLLGFLWSMTTMGSGTAFIALGLLSFYFIRPQYLFSIVPLLIVLYIAIPYINWPPLQRAHSIVEATMTMETETVIDTDGSAASRVVPLINTITKLNVFDIDTWFGHGIDYTKNMGGYLNKVRGSRIGGIQEYGLLSFIVMQLFVLYCCIYKFKSIETLFWIFLFSATFANVAYVWGAMMIFTVVRYFQVQNKNGELEITDNNEDEE